MKLTGKALLDFNEWSRKRRGLCEYERESLISLSNPAKKGLYIEWLSAMGLWEHNFYKAYRSTKFKFYKTAVNQAIIKCNKIYNSYSDEGSSI